MGFDGTLRWRDLGDVSSLSAVLFVRSPTRLRSNFVFINIGLLF